MPPVTAPDEVDDSEDEHLTESEALKRAEAEGITFVDTFNIANIDTLQVAGGTGFATRAEADAALNQLPGKDKYTVMQIRTQKS